MSNLNMQKKEIETIKERKITVKLSDADCERLLRKCGEHGLTVGELIANFVGDLVDGTYSNGSDERMYAERWFERCWFGMFPEPTLLNHLLCWGYNPEDYLDTLDNIETAQNDKKYLEEHPEEADEEAQYIDEDIEDWEEELKSMREGWKPEKEPNLAEELNIIKKWIKEKDSFIANNSYTRRFKEETLKHFNPIGIYSSPREIEHLVWVHVYEILEESGLDAQISNIAIYGSRCRGLEHETSDLDIVIEIDTNEKEYILFNLLNEKEFFIENVKIDINPITRFETGFLEDYLIKADKFLSQKELGLKLYNAVKAGSIPLIDEILSHDNVDVNFIYKPDTYGYTPLHMAAYYALNNVIYNLVSKGANINALSKDGKTPLDLAKERHNEAATIELLMKLGAISEDNNCYKHIKHGR